MRLGLERKLAFILSCEVLAQDVGSEIKRIWRLFAFEHAPSTREHSVQLSLHL